MATLSLEDKDYKELFKQLEGITVTFADGTPSTMDKEMHKALAKLSTKTNKNSNNSNSSNNLNNSNNSNSSNNLNNKRKGKGKNKMRSNL